MKYPLSMRILHWTMAVIILGMVWAGWTMVSMDDHVPAKFDVFYPWHKSFGMLILILVLLRFANRARAAIPALPTGLAPWEARTAKIAHIALYTLMIAVPCMGYAMSSSYTQSDGVFFFGFNLPELLPKNDARFEVFQLLHRYLAYTLLGVITLHTVGALKHRFFDKDRSNDVLSRMT
ncbi:MAG TPA: cytochrome b [Steroidobacteraceae bacterium]|nr:cytochrome b [Steroidobacteraceae bacterium]